MIPRSDIRIMAVSPDRDELRDQLPNVLESLLQGGATAFMMREKSLSDDTFLALGIQLRSICDQYGATFILNERIEMAEPMGARVVHLTWKSTPLDFGDKPKGLKVGRSIHSLAEATSSDLMNGLDYVVAGPVYWTPSKEGLVAPIGPEIIRQICDVSQIPVVAIGGIKLNNIREVAATGVDGLAGISAFFASEEPQLAAKKFSAARGEFDVD